MTRGSEHATLIVGDLGNSSVRLAEFPEPFSAARPGILPEPTRVFQASWDTLKFDAVEAWVEQRPDKSRANRWRLGSVNRAGLQTFSDWIQDRDESIQTVTHANYSMPTTIRYPERVGIDRLAASFAANTLRPPHHAAIVVDAGTAITIDCVSSAGQFVGGIIAPGIQLGLESLHTKTDLLPATTLHSIPPLIGNETNQAIQSGVYWLTAHGIQGTVDRLSNELAGPSSVFATGGSMPHLLPSLSDDVQHVPHLVLSGLALANS